MVGEHSSGEHSASPAFRFLNDEGLRSRLVLLRNAVMPILANNVLHHFTDHTVSHSDNLCGLVDSIIEPLQSTSLRLTDREIAILYSACYLHDLGMQFENAGATQVVQGLNLNLRWEDLEENTRRDLLRDNHHRISAELVFSSIRSGAPPIGIQMTDADGPPIACLCEAHCVTPETSRYDVLMSDVPGVRMRLLSGLVRLADILDESRHRACREKARTLLLNTESQTHWWRHYYTRGVDFDVHTKAITIWFEFPKDRAEEYQRVIPELQIPWIQAELDHHRAAFTTAGFGWMLQTKFVTGPYNNVEEMPEIVLGEMYKQLLRRRTRLQERSHQVALTTFKEARPHIQRRLKALNEERGRISVDEYITGLAKVAGELWDIGSRRSAWMTMSGEFERAYSTLAVSTRLKVGNQLLRMLMDDEEPSIGKTCALLMANDVKALPQADPLRFQAQQTLAEWFLQMCAYDQAVDAFDHAIQCSTDCNARSMLDAELAEMHFLQGELEKVIEPILRKESE